MKKIVALCLAFMLCTGIFAGCGTKAPQDAPSEDSSTSTDATDKALKVVMLIPGVLGDKSYYDSANAGMQAVKDNYGAEIKVVEMGSDSTKYEPSIYEFAEDGTWDIIIVCTNNLREIADKVAEEYQDQKFILFGARADYDQYKIPNLYSVDYKANEGSYLAGAVAACVTTSDMKGANAEKVIGFVGGQDVTVINDFLVGYIEGARSVEPEIKVITSYVGDYVNAAKGKELTLAQIQQGADVVFQVAGGAGAGVFEAAKDKGVFAIGCDADQYEEFASSDIDMANVIVTSVMKRVGVSIDRAVGLSMENKLPWGELEVVGVAEGVTGIAKNDHYNEILSQEIRDKVDEIEAKVVKGEIAIPTALGMSVDQVNEIRDKVK
ncbi:MAG: BMP family ABC transporter substrate-binding protein [Oscillospiraceae bacterium]